MPPLRPLPLVLLLMTLTLSAQAQDRPQAGLVPDQPVTQEGPLTSENVEESQMPPPTEQGTRPPEPHPGDGDEQVGTDLYDLLAAVRQAPPDIEGGQTFARPNDLASEPAKEMEPAQPTDAYLFPENYIE